jgi:hypothetical protein
LQSFREQGKERGRLDEAGVVSDDERGLGGGGGGEREREGEGERVLKNLTTDGVYTDTSLSLGPLSHLFLMMYTGISVKSLE